MTALGNGTEKKETVKKASKRNEGNKMLEAHVIHDFALLWNWCLQTTWKHRGKVVEWCKKQMQTNNASSTGVATPNVQLLTCSPPTGVSRVHDTGRRLRCRPKKLEVGGVGGHVTAEDHDGDAKASYCDNLRNDDEPNHKHGHLFKAVDNEGAFNIYMYIYIYLYI